MADVQLEHGYTKIANEILERMALTKLSPTQFRLIFVIWRYTYGFNRKDHEMSLSFLAEATGVHKQRVKQELDKLIESNIIIVTEEGTFSKSRKLAFNKDYDTWRLQSTKESTVSEIAYTTVSKNADTTVSEIADTTVSEFAYQEIKDINKDLNKNIDVVVVNAHRFYQDNFGPMSPYIAECITKWAEDTSDEIVIEAMKRALKQQKKWNYAEGILQDWAQNNLRTIEDIEAYEREFHRKREEVNNREVHKHRRGISRPAKEGGKTYEQILREAEEARRAWGWKG
ncbi:MAG: replication protein [candidate division KSB1 bacterium]|nr:replication protein [candidate division KSB1 bacterium]